MSRDWVDWASSFLGLMYTEFKLKIRAVFEMGWLPVEMIRFLLVKAMV